MFIKHIQLHDYVTRYIKIPFPKLALIKIDPAKQIQVHRLCGRLVSSVHKHWQFLGFMVVGRMVHHNIFIIFYKKPEIMCQCCVYFGPC